MKINNTLWPMALLLCVLSSGCGTMRLMSIIDPDDDALSGARFPYSSVAGDILLAGMEPPESILILADLPVAAAVDTLCLPFHIFGTIKRAEKRRIETEKKYPEGATPPTESTPSLDATGSGNRIRVPE